MRRGTRSTARLEMGYAQSHPLADFAETFAVWLRPGSRCPTRYRNWPAIKKLETVDEWMQQPYSGCNPRGLLLSKDKALSKKILTYHRILTPGFAVFRTGRTMRRPKRLTFPLFVKSVTEDASYAISQAAIVYDDEALAQRVAFMHKKTSEDALVEQYIEGRELCCGILGNDRLVTFPAREVDFGTLPAEAAPIATSRVKWDLNYQQRHQITAHAAKGLDPLLKKRISKLCKRVSWVLSMSGYGRMDLRLTLEGEIYVIEANANPNIEYGEALIQRILNLGLSYKAAWMA